MFEEYWTTVKSVSSRGSCTRRKVLLLMISVQFLIRGPCIDSDKSLPGDLFCTRAMPSPSTVRSTPARRAQEPRTRPDKRDRRSARRWACGDQAHELAGANGTAMPHAR